MKKYYQIILILILSLGFNSILNSAPVEKKSKKDEAINAYTNKCLHYLQSNNLDSALIFANMALELDSTLSDLVYNKALIFVKKGKHQKAIDILEPMLTKMDSRDYHYQLIASSYDIIGSKKAALAILDTALTKFPNSGRIYYELGILYYGIGEKDKAIQNWSDGVDKEPTFDGNYYHLAMHYSSSLNKIWTLYYGECYVALSSNSQKSKKISKMMYDILTNSYKNGHFDLVDTTIDLVSSMVSFEYNLSYSLDSVYSTKKIVPQKMGLREIYLLYSEFLDNYIRNGNQERYKSPLLDYKKKLRDKGANYLEVFTYLMFSNGDAKELSQWLDKNENKYEECTKWLEKNNFGKFLSENLKRYRLTSE